MVTKLKKSFPVLLFLFALLFPGCSEDNYIYTESYVFGQDSQYGFIGNNSVGFITESENGYYFLGGPNNVYLYFYDTEKEKAIPLCNKPNCLHDRETDSRKVKECNAFIGNPRFLKYYMGNLYYVMDSSSEVSKNYFYMMSADGTSRRQILDCKDMIQNIQIHRGFIYYSTSDMGTISEKEDSTTTKFKLCRFEVNAAGAKPEVIFEGFGVYGNIGDIVCYGNNIFFETHYQQENNGIFIINKYDIQTKTLTKVIGGSPQFTIFNGMVVYYNGRNGLFACDLNGGNVFKINDARGYICANDNYLFIDNLPVAATEGGERNLTIVGKNWKTIKSVSLAGIKVPPYGCSNDYYFVPVLNEHSEYGASESISCIPINNTVDEMNLEIFYENMSNEPIAGEN